MVVDGKLFKPDTERERRGGFVVQRIFGGRLVLAEVDAAALPEEVRHERAGEDHDQRDMDAERKQPLRHPGADQVNQAADGDDGPQGNEYGIVVHHAERRRRSLQPFKNRGSHHRDDEDCQDSETQILKSFHTVYILSQV